MIRTTITFKSMLELIILWHFLHTESISIVLYVGWKSDFAVHAFDDGILLHQPKSDQDWIKASVLQKRYLMVKWQLSFLKDINFILEPLGKDNLQDKPFCGFKRW